jgi:hypothetical protein
LRRYRRAADSAKDRDDRQRSCRQRGRPQTPKRRSPYVTVQHGNRSDQSEGVNGSIDAAARSLHRGGGESHRAGDGRRRREPDAIDSPRSLGCQSTRVTQARHAHFDGIGASGQSVCGTPYAARRSRVHAGTVLPAGCLPLAGRRPCRCVANSANRWLNAVRGCADTWGQC